MKSISEKTKLSIEALSGHFFKVKVSIAGVNELKQHVTPFVFRISLILQGPRLPKGLLKFLLIFNINVYNMRISVQLSIYM